MLIKKKINICSCGNVSYGFKKCTRCRSIKYSEKKVEKKREHINRKIVTQKTDLELDNFFNRHIRIIAESGIRCQECGIPIINPSRWNVAHILPKSIFKSISTMDENTLYLCRTNGCHAKFDSSWDTASKMKIWPVALLKIKSIIFLVKENHKILNYFK